MTFERSLPGFTYAIGSPPGMACIVCHATGRAFLFRKGEDQAGICEACSGLARWAWRQVEGESVPGGPEDPVISRVYVLVCRRKRIPRADAPHGTPEDKRMMLAPAEMNGSYEFLLVDQPDGSLDLPSVAGLGLPSSGDREIVAAAMRSLSDVGMTAWDAVMEPLYTAYTPRGHLVSVVLARAWSEASVANPSGRGRCWRSWPISAHAGALSGFWRSLETVWPLRLHKHCVQGEPEDLCVQVRRAGREYIALQDSTGEYAQADASMTLALRAGMSVDELAIARMIHLAAGRGRDEEELAKLLPKSKLPKKMAVRDRPSKPAKEEEPGPIPEEDSWPELALPGSESGEESLGDSADEGEEEQDGDLGDADDDIPGPDGSGFVRPGRPLGQE